MTLTDINNLVIKQQDCDPKLHRWKTWEANTPFAPNIDASIYIDNLQIDLVDDLFDLIKNRNVGSYKDKAWEKYNLFAWQDDCILDLKNFIWKMYCDYSNSVSVETYHRDYIWIRGWAVKLEENENIGMHSHSLHENTFISGNISITENNTTTDYWIPLFSLYHGTYQCGNRPGKITMFPSWLQHGVNPNTSGKDRYSMAFDLFTKKSLDYVIENNTKETEQGKLILLSVPL